MGRGSHAGSSVAAQARRSGGGQSGRSLLYGPRHRRRVPEHDASDPASRPIADVAWGAEMVPPTLEIEPVVERDLPLLELLAAAPRQRIPEDKIEAVALIAAGRKLLQTAFWLEVSPSNGHGPHIEGLQARALSAADYRCLFFSPQGFALTEEGQRYVERLGLEISDETEAEIASLVTRGVPELEAMVAKLWSADGSSC